MTMRLNPYLNFGDEARAALEFYQSVFGGELTLSTFGEFDMGGDDPDQAAKIMHGQLETPGGLVLMASDTPPGVGDPVIGTSINVSLSGDEADAMTEIWTRLTVDAEIVVPLAPAPWGDSFGLLNDRYGVAWLVNVAGTVDTTT